MYLFVSATATVERKQVLWSVGQNLSQTANLSGFTSPFHDVNESLRYRSPRVSAATVDQLKK